ncbi:hypothetical protein [Lentzea flaviverrucosa]|uniref:Uncharacterized protein n=1 Tax=Lentzea flaviverrucosa TaxID=200379 RepID=A0A1H9LX14_9PSEU|nr:hypothetical protein [Lentzea flaviverrucosa]RDI31162.1 hypothetical protein DFR72_104499 [Lentzea flaviverrucosa]SER15799.1 hypothetical protein SAMN05216195_104127 [Lentzea flaviverrucosa]
MGLRAVAGASAGLFTAVGWHLTWRLSLSPACLSVTDRRCGPEHLIFPTAYAIGWAIAGGLLLFAGLKLVKLPHAGSTAGLGCLLWPFAAFGFLLLGATRDYVGIGVPVVAFGLAGALIGRRPRHA